MPVSAEQRQAIRSLLAANRIGVSPSTVAAIKAHMTMGTYGDDGAPQVEAEVANAVDTAFGLERDLQLALRRSIGQLEPGLAIIDGDREQQTVHPAAST